jgi:Fe-S-cluster-containing dehydrogenase component
MKKAYMIIDIERCIDCNNCMLACKDEFVENDWLPYAIAQPRLGQRWMDIMCKERGQFPLIDVAYRPTPCMHCDSPDCMVGAEDGAIYKREDGIVIIDPVKAKGQKAITESCPYGAIWWNEEAQVPQKCTLCAHLLDDGWEHPRCVQACATDALRFAFADDEEIEKIIAVENLEVLHPEFNAEPRVYYKNLYRYASCFIGGSVAVDVNGVADCMSRASVTLCRGEEEIAQEMSDAFGDFRFDGLKKDSGNYRLNIAYSGKKDKTVEVELENSLNIGTIWL